MRGATNFLIGLMWAGASFAQTTEPAPTAPVNTAARWVRLFERDKSGFTMFPLGEGARLILISTSDGSDFNDGMFQPVRTLKKALSVARNGFPDRILFKRGDTFLAANLNANIDLQGRGPLEPLIVGAYGSLKLPRPVLESHLGLGGRVTPRFLAIQGLDIYAESRDTSLKSFQIKRAGDQPPAGIGLVSPGSFLWIEDCRIRDFGFGMVLQSKDNDLFNTLIIRRCQILDSWDVGHSSGIYVDSYQNVLIEENLFDHNGWVEGINGAGKNMFNHNMYLQHGAVGEDRHFIVRNNISARASSYGCEFRPGGLLENNLFLKNPEAAYVSYSPSVVRNNVVLDGDGMGPGIMSRGVGLEFLNCATVLAEGNIVAHKTDKSNPLEALSYKPIGNDDVRLVPSRGEFRGNVVYDWTGLAFKTVSNPAGLLVHDNSFEQEDSPLIELKNWKAGYVFRNNHYVSSVAEPFQIAKKDMDFKGWQAQTGEAALGPAKFVDPSRDIASYAKSIGLSDPTMEGFLAAAREQRHGNWDDRLTAGAVNDYIRAGFGEKP